MKVRLKSKGHHRVEKLSRNSQSDLGTMSENQSTIHHGRKRTHLSLDHTIKYFCLPDSVFMLPSMSPVHHIPTRDGVSTQVAHETVPDLDVGDRRDSISGTWESIFGLWLRPVLQRGDNRAPITFVVTMEQSRQMPHQGIDVDPDLTLSTDGNVPGLVVAYDFIRMERRYVGVMCYDRESRRCNVRIGRRGIAKQRNDHGRGTGFRSDGQKPTLWTRHVK